MLFWRDHLVGELPRSNGQTTAWPSAPSRALRVRERVNAGKLIALACSKPPKGRVRWTLRLLENKVVELGIVDRASDSTIGRALKKTRSSPIADSAGSFRRRRTARS